MGWFDDDSEQYDAHKQWKTTLLKVHFKNLKENKGLSLLIQTTKNEWVTRKSREAKEILAAFVGAFIDREVETNGLNLIDKEKAKRHANEQLHDASYNDYQ